MGFGASLRHRYIHAFAGSWLLELLPSQDGRDQHSFGSTALSVRSGKSHVVNGWLTVVCCSELDCECLSTALFGSKRVKGIKLASSKWRGSIGVPAVGCECLWEPSHWTHCAVAVGRAADVRAGADVLGEAVLRWGVFLHKAEKLGEAVLGSLAVFSSFPFLYLQNSWLQWFDELDKQGSVCAKFSFHWHAQCSDCPECLEGVE